MIDKDILIKPTCKMRNPDSELRGEGNPGSSSVRKSSRNEAQMSHKVNPE